MKFKILFLSFLCISCQTPQKQISGQCQNTKEPVNTEVQNIQELPPVNMNSIQILELASQLLNNDSPEQALDLLNTIPVHEQNLQYKKMKRDAINSIVMNLRYKVRILYEKSMQQEKPAKQTLLLQCRQILEIITKNYPEYDDMYAVRNNLKQIEKALSRKS